MAEDEYEILPHQLLADLKDDVEALKKKLTQPDTKVNELILEIESMKDSIHELNSIFQKAIQETKEEDPARTLKLLQDKVGTVLSQNEVIAKGMVAISDKLEDWMRKQGMAGPARPAMAPAPSTAPMSFSGPNMTTPQMSMAPPTPMAGPRFAPRPEMNFSNPNSDLDFPPPPPSLSGKKRASGLF
ncbi:MAG TPA: hypothetical protein VJA23_03835 [Candidatus Nanoarchaeia archaeon]|nr:hypothetical protein [Candidatus Nanoarchaeia archaeon]